VTVTTGHTEKIYTVQFHPLANGVLTSSSYDMTVRVWDVNSEEERIVLLGHEDTVSVLLLKIFVVAEENLT